MHSLSTNPLDDPVPFIQPLMRPLPRIWLAYIPLPVKFDRMHRLFRIRGESHQGHTLAYLDDVGVQRSGFTDGEVKDPRAGLVSDAEEIVKAFSGGRNRYE